MSTKKELEATLDAQIAELTEAKAKLAAGENIAIPKIVYGKTHEGTPEELAALIKYIKSIKKNYNLLAGFIASNLVNVDFLEDEKELIKEGKAILIAHKVNKRKNKAELAEQTTDK